jgi:excisionase family DNA binding protein
MQPVTPFSRDERTIRLLTSAEVADVLSVSRERVTQLVREGRLGAIRLGPRGRYRFHPDTISRLVAEAKSRPAELEDAAQETDGEITTSG